MVVHVFAAAVLALDQFCASSELFFLIICHIFFNKTGQGAILLCPFANVNSVILACAEPIPTLSCLSLLVVLLGTEFVVLHIIDSVEGVFLAAVIGTAIRGTK